MTPIAGPVEFSPLSIAVILLFLSIPGGLPGALWGVITRKPRLLWFFLGYFVFLIPAVLVRELFTSFTEERSSDIAVFLEQLGNTLYVVGPTIVAVVLVVRWYRRTQRVAPPGSAPE